MRNKIYSELNI